MTEGLKFFGSSGAAGLQGPQGEQGITGATGPQGVKGDTGPESVQGIELFYSEDATAVNATTGTTTNIPGSTGTFTVRNNGKPLHVSYGGFIRSAGIGDAASMQLWIDGVVVTGSALVFTSSTANAGCSVARVKRLSLTAGDHTIKLTISASGLSTSTAKGDTGSPSWVTVEEA